VSEDTGTTLEHAPAVGVVRCPMLYAYHARGTWRPAPGALVPGFSLSGAMLDRRMRARPGVWYAHPTTIAAIMAEVRDLDGYADAWAETLLRRNERARLDDDGWARPAWRGEEE
jgi:hypothetical protein